MVIPEALVGVGAFHILPGGNWGLFADTKFSRGSKEDEPYFLADQKAADLEATLPVFRRNHIKAYGDWLFVSGGIIRALSREVAIMLGGGMVERTVIREYFDETDQAPSPSGFYFVRDERDSGWYMNGNAGVLMRAGQNLVWSIGFEARPRSLSAGVFWVFR
jgi:hypothetical protein